MNIVVSPHYEPREEAKLEETKRLSRVLELIQLIAMSPRRYKRRDLAERFEVSERMIGKDFEIIRNGLKLELVVTPDGYAFNQVPLLPALNLPLQEALALVNLVFAARGTVGVASPELAAAVSRLEALFPAEFTPLLREIASASAPSGFYARRQEYLQWLQYARANCYKVRMEYSTGSRQGKRSIRVIHPYDTYIYGRSWMLVAYCESRRETLMFKVDRINTLKILPEAQFTFPADYNLDTYMGSTWGALRGESGPVHAVLLQFDALAGRWVREEFWHTSQQFEEQADGTVLCRLQVPLSPEFIRWLMNYGARVRVLEPDHLRAQLVEAHQAAIAINLSELQD